MSMQDPIADMLTRIRNAQSMGIKQLALPHSNFKADILNVLVNEGYIDSFDVNDEENNKKSISINLKYYQGLPVIEKIKRISKPALRIYKRYEELPSVRGGLGISIVSTSKGIMSDKQARSQKVGGEVICTVE